MSSSRAKGINSYKRFRESRCLHLQDQAVHDEVINVYFNFTYFKQAFLHSRYVAVINSSIAQCKHKVPLDFSQIQYVDERFTFSLWTHNQ